MLAAIVAEDYRLIAKEPSADKQIVKLLRRQKVTGKSRETAIQFLEALGTEIAYSTLANLFVDLGQYDRASKYGTFAVMPLIRVVYKTCNYDWVGMEARASSKALGSIDGLLNSDAGQSRMARKQAARCLAALHSLRSFILDLLPIHERPFPVRGIGVIQVLASLGERRAVPLLEELVRRADISGETLAAIIDGLCELGWPNTPTERQALPSIESLIRRKDSVALGAILRLIKRKGWSTTSEEEIQFRLAIKYFEDEWRAEAKATLDRRKTANSRPECPKGGKHEWFQPSDDYCLPICGKCGKTKFPT